MRYRLAPWAAVVLALSAGAVAAAPVPESVRLLESSASGTRFEIRIPAAQVTPLADAGAVAERVDIEGYTPSVVAGEPELPLRVFTVAVPASGSIRVSALAFDEVAREGVTLARVPFVSREGEVSDGPEPSAASSPRPWARLIEVGWLRHQRIARIEVQPVRYDVATRQLRSTTRIDVTVQVDGATVPVSAVPDSDAFEPLYREMLVNYEQGRAWRSRTASIATPAPRRGGTLASRDLSQASAVPDSSIFIGRRWIKIAVRRSGFYKLSFSQFKSLAPFNGDTTVASDSVRLYTWAGSPVLPERIYCDTCGYREVAIGIVDDDTRLNHSGDAIYFHALGPSDWADRFDSQLPDTVFINHPYETRNFYYLGVSTATLPLPSPSKRITLRNGAPSGGSTVTPATFTERVHSESDLNYDPDRYPGTSSYVWDKWFWTKLKELGTFASSVDAPGADTLQNARLRARLWSTYGGPCASNQQQQMRTTWNNLDAGVGTFSWRGYTGFTIDTPVSGTRRRGNGLRITASDLVCTVNTAIAVSWFDLFYPRTYEPSGERLEFKAPASGGTLLYEVGPFEGPARPRLFDITDPLGAVEITGATYAPVTGGFRLAFESTDNAKRRYVALPDTGFAGLPSGDVTTASGTSVDNLRSRTQQADYLVIYYDPLQSAADTLAAWRRFHNGYRTKTVPISAIYDQFSGGRTDPTAIRNFLRAAYYNWNTQPTYVMMLGDASYDFKNQLGRAAAGQPGNPLPTYENNFEAGSLRQFTTDDWLFNVDSAVVVVPDFLGGRLPVPDANSAMAVVRDKVLHYERSAPMGGYRNRVMLIADDNLQGSRPDDLGWAHLQQTQQLDSLSLPSVIDRDYVYLHTYPTRANQTKPDVRDSIVAHLDHGGVLLMNYVGHGSPFKIADESVLIATDADALSNRDRLPLFVAASCDVGRFSDPANSSLGEHMMNSPAGGAIGVISATDLAYSSANSTLNKIIFQSLFGRLASGEMSGQVAAALALGKAGGTVNGQKYQLMGDAALRLNLPRYWVEVHLRDEAGADTTEIRQGRRMSYTGRVLDRPNGTLVPLDGVADVLVEDSKPLLQAPACPDPSKYLCSPAALPYYFYSAGPVFRGPAAVQAGVFSGEFIVPLEARPGARGRIRAYLSGSTPSSVSTDAAGDLKLRVVTGTLPGGDTRGPSIVLSFPNGATRVRPDAILRVDLTDSSGILITGHTPQNGIIVTVDGNSTSRVDLTEGFRYNSGSYQSGSVTFQLPNLSEGFHTTSISAADNLAAGLVAGQHRSQATLEFEVVQSPQLRVLSSYLFPDPMSSRGNSRGGQFVVDTEGGAVDAQVRIYTVAGRLIRLLTAAGAEGQLQLPWDGFDAEGQELANGVYLYKVVVRSGGARSSGDQEQHSGTVGRFVIVNP